MFRRPGDVPTVGLVGGPGAGKSTLWEALRHDNRLVLVPEAPTLLRAHGLWYPSNDPEFEIDLDSMRWLLERKSARAAQARGARMIVTDRIVGEGRMVYCHDREIAAATPVAEVLASYFALLVVNMPPADIWLAHRLDNPARRETYPEALEVHSRILAYVDSHPRKHFIGNDRNSALKVARGVEVIEHLLAEIETLRQSS